MKVQLDPTSTAHLEALIQELVKLNPYMETKVSVVVSQLVCLAFELKEESFKQVWAARLTSPEGRRRALLDELKTLSATEDQATLDYLEKGLRRLKERFKKQGSEAEPKEQN